MLKLPQKSLDKIKSYLQKQQKQVDEELKELDRDDLALNNDTPESSEPGTDSFVADVHSRMTALKNSLQDLSKKITLSLRKLRSGTYGKCERCGKPVEPARLEVLPTATMCLSCSNKSSK